MLSCPLFCAESFSLGCGSFHVLILRLESKNENARDEIMTSNCRKAWAYLRKYWQIVFTRWRSLSRDPWGIRLISAPIPDHSTRAQLERLRADASRAKSGDHSVTRGQLGLPFCNKKSRL